MKVVNWKITLNTGANLDLNVMDGDRIDKNIRKWVESLKKPDPKFLFEKFEQGEIWISPKDFSMAARTMLQPQAPQAFQGPQEYVKIEDNDDISLE